MLTKHFCVVFFVFGVICSMSLGCVEKYRDQGNLLSKESNKYLISRGFCSVPQECNKKLGAYAGHGNRINYSIYIKNNRAMIAAFVGFVIEKGFKISKGIPITIRVYPKTREEYGSFFFKPKEIIKVEVNQ